MNSSDRLPSVAAAGMIVCLRGSVRSAGSSSVVLGLIWLTLGRLAYVRGEDSFMGVVLLVMGLSLVAEGIYVIRTRSAGALQIEAITLAVLALLNFGSFAYSRMGYPKGHPHPGHQADAVVGLIMAFIAWSSWKARKVLLMLEPLTTAEDKQVVETAVAAALTIPPDTLPNVVKLKQTGMSVDDAEWRVLFDPEYVYVVNTHSFFNRKLRPVSVGVSPRASLSYQITGDVWIGKSQKLKLVLDGVAAQPNFEITPAMLERLQFLAHSGATEMQSR